MKKNLFMIAGAVTLLLGMSACNDALDLDKTLKFTALSVEEQKMKIEESGNGVADALDEMNTTKAGAALNGLSSLPTSPLSPALISLSRDLVNKNPQFARNFDQALRAPRDSSDAVWGNYEWDLKNKEWDYTSGTKNEITMSFPGSKFAESNNCEVKVVYTESTESIVDSMNLDDNSFSKLPSKITFVMKVDGATAMKADFSAKYDTDGVPTQMKQSLDISSFNWTAEVKRSETEASEKYSFSKGLKTILKSEAVVNGALTLSELQDSEAPQDIVNSLAVYFQMMDVAVKGGTKDLQAFQDDMDAFNKKDTTTGFTTEKARVEAEAKVYNDNFVAVAFFVDSKKKFADVEYYVLETEVNDYDKDALLVYTGDYGWNGDYDYTSINYNSYPYKYNYYKYQTKPDYNLSQRLLLSDGSKVNLNDYNEQVLGDVYSRLWRYEDKLSNYNN